ALAFDKKTVAEQVYGRQGIAANWLYYNPRQFMPDSGQFEFNLTKAGQMLDDEGWKKGSDGVRAKDGKKMKVVYQTSVNDVRQNTQAIIKKGLESLGVQVELKSVDSGVFFGGDPNNPDNINHFFADLEMYTSNVGPDPQTYLRSWVSALEESDAPDSNIAQKANSYSRPNYYRYQNPDYDKLWRQARAELDPIKRADLIKKMQQTIVGDAVSIPLINRKGVSVAKNNLQGMDLSPFDSDLWKIAYWHRA
ncbi:MAG: ABC transporter substrate-binding protein, partial [Dehalococcoidia bacterium]